MTKDFPFKILVYDFGDQQVGEVMDVYYAGRDEDGRIHFAGHAPYIRATVARLELYLDKTRVARGPIEGGAFWVNGTGADIDMPVRFTG